MGTFLLHVSDAFTSPLQSSLYGNLMNAPIFKSNQPSTILSMSASYGKGAEIWPETNLEPIRLGDSFPTRQVPGMLDAMVEISKNKSTTPIDIQFSSFDKLSIGLVCSLLTLRLVSFGEIFFSVSFSTYLILLTRINVAMAKNKSVVVPSLPPLGHIPSLVANPLGQGFTNSPTYRLWLRMGVVGSVFLPLISLLWCLVGSRDSVAASFVAKPLYLICFQSVSEVIAKKVSFFVYILFFSLQRYIFIYGSIFFVTQPSKLYLIHFTFSVDGKIDSFHCFRRLIEPRIKIILSAFSLLCFVNCTRNKRFRFL